MRFSLPSIIITITSNEPWNRETNKIRQQQITNHDFWTAKVIDGSEKRKRQLAFELQNSSVCFWKAQ